MTQCSAFGCKNKGIHVFPKDSKRRKLWERALGRKNWKTTNTSRLCSSHFKSDDYHGISAYTGHSHLTSQPVVIVERLRGKNLTRDMLPPPSRRETVETRPWEYPHERVNNNVTTSKKPEPPKLQTVKKKKEYKKVHPMALRSRRPSKLELNKLIAQSSASLRKVASKRKKNSSDEDEPLIFQKTRLKQTAEQPSTSKQTAARESAPKENILKPSSPKENTLKLSSPKEKSPKNKPCKKRSKMEITTNEVTTHETTTKEITRSKTTTKNLPENTKQSIARKTPMKRTQQKKRIHKKCSPMQPGHVAPESSIPDFVITVIKEDLTDVTVIQDDKARLDTPDDSVIEVVPDDPLFPDVLDNLVTPVVPVPTDDLVIPPVPVMRDVSNIPLPPPVLDDLDRVLSSLDEVSDEEGIICSKHVDNSMVKEKSPKTVSTILHIVPVPEKRVPEGRPDDKPLSLYDVPNLNDDEPIILHSVPIPKNRVPEDPFDKQSSHDAPMVNNDLPAILRDLQMINGDVPEDTDDVLIIKDDVPEDTDDITMTDYDVTEDTDDVPMTNNYVPEDTDDILMTNVDVPEDTGDVPNDNIPEDMCDVPNDYVPEDTGDPDVPFDFHHSIRYDSPITNLRIASPEPGPSGMEMQFKVYNSSSEEYDVVYCDHPMYLGRVKDEPVRLERARNVQSEKPTPCVAAECRPSDADEPVHMEVLENTVANLERTQNVQLETPMPCAAAACRTDKDVINASKEFLDSRCKVCKPCIRIDKLMKVSALLESKIGLSSKRRQNKAAVQENEPTEREGGTEDVEIEIDNENANSTNADPGNIYLLVPNHTIMMNLKAILIHGKKFVGAGMVPKNESLINKEFSLEEHETLLDQVIENLTIYSDINFEGRDVNLVSRDDNLEGREVNSEVRHDNTQVRSDNTEGRNDNTEGRNDNTEGRHGNTEGRNDNTEGLHDKAEGRNDNTKGRNDNSERQNYIPVRRRVSISSDSTAEINDTTTEDQKTPIRLSAEKRRIKRMAVKKKLAEMHERMREEKEREIARVEEEKRQEISRITAEKNSAVEQMSRYHERFTQMEKEKQRHLALLKMKIRQDVISKIEAKRHMDDEADGIAANLDKEKDAKNMDPEELSDQEAPGTSGSILPTDGGLLVDAPVYHPTEEDFGDPLRYYEKIWPEAVRFGLCKVVPPPGWKPPFRVDDEMRFDVTNQYISRLFNRWGPAARELCAIKLSLAQQKVNFTRPPLLDGVEVNLPKLYHLVQRHGGLETVYNKKRWGKVAEDMKFNKGPNTERKLDQIYVKYLLPYDTLSHQERQDIMRKVEIAWNRKHQKLLDRALNPLNRQQRLLGLIDSSDDETEDEDTVAAVNEAEDCIIKGAVMNRAKFKKIATMTYENTFGQGSEAADPPDLAKIEEYYWRLVTLATEHVCVHTAAIDTGEEGYGFIKNKSDSYGRHPWNPKMVSQNPRNVLQYLGQILGVTVPTLLLGMLFSTSCWHKDPHAVAWLEFQLLGPERIWYGIPADQADNFRKAVETLCPTSCQNKFHWLPTDITMIPPNLLREHNVTLSRVTQRDGEYILAFPNAYTCCISTGYTESESVYFAPPSWLESLWTVFKEARESCEPTMFAMEHLLYNIGKDSKADPTILKIAQPLFDKMLREEVTNRQMLQERGLPFVQELLSANSSRKKNTANPFNPRDQDECEYCRATLYLSKVKGLTGRNTVLCLEHALKLLDTEKYKDTVVDQLQVLVHVSVKELNNVHDDMKRRLGTPTA